MKIDKSCMFTSDVAAIRQQLQEQEKMRKTKFPGLTFSCLDFQTQTDFNNCLSEL